MVPADDDLFGGEHVRVYRETAGARGHQLARCDGPDADDAGANVGETADLPADPSHRR